MGAMGDLFAEAVCKQCMELEEYGGTGSGIADDAFFPTSCKLMLPGRTDWVFEMDGRLKWHIPLQGLETCRRSSIAGIRLDCSKNPFLL